MGLMRKKNSRYRSSQYTVGDSLGMKSLLLVTNMKNIERTDVVRVINYSFSYYHNKIVWILSKNHIYYFTTCYRITHPNNLPKLARMDYVHSNTTITTSAHSHSFHPGTKHQHPSLLKYFRFRETKSSVWFAKHPRKEITWR